MDSLVQDGNPPDIAIPRTLADFVALAGRMARDGNHPFCLGLGSEFAIGWPLTDWIEDFLLRLEGPDVYDAGYRHEIAFDDADVVTVARYVYDLLSQPGYVYGGLEDAAERLASSAGDRVLTGGCMTYRMSHYYVGNRPENVRFGPDGESSPSTCRDRLRIRPSLCPAASMRPPSRTTRRSWR